MGSPYAPIQPWRKKMTEPKDCGKAMLKAEDSVKRFNIKNNHKKIDYELLWKDFMNCCLEFNYFLEVKE